MAVAATWSDIIGHKVVVLESQTPRRLGKLVDCLRFDNDYFIYPVQRSKPLGTFIPGKWTLHTVHFKMDVEQFNREGPIGATLIGHDSTETQTILTWERPNKDVFESMSELYFLSSPPPAVAASRKRFTAHEQ